MNNFEKKDGIYIRLAKLLAEHRVGLIENIENFNYVTEGKLDSFELLSFISDVEIEFDIDISIEDITNKKNQIINGLAELILEKK